MRRQTVSSHAARDWQRLTWAHGVATAVFVLLAASGFVLMDDGARAWAAAAGLSLRRLHAWAGAAFAALLAAVAPPAYRHLLRLLGVRGGGVQTRRPGKAANLVLVYAFGAALAATGVVLWSTGWFGAGLRAWALAWHRWLTYAAVAWAVGHTARAALRRRERPQARLVLARRQLLQAAVAGAGALAAGACLRWFWPFLDLLPGRGGGAAAGGGRGYFRIYRVTSEDPVFDPQTWRLQVNGLVAKPLELDWAAVRALPRARVVYDFLCVTGWRVRGVTWEGVPLAAVLQAAGVKPEARYVECWSADGLYMDNLRLDEALAADTLLAYSLDGKPLPRRQGEPLRLVVPRKYGYKSVKWVDRIVVTDRFTPGYWEQRGYDANGDIPA